MMVESGQVVDVGNNYVWVESVSAGRCESCSSKTVCCQDVFGVPDSRESHIKILLGGRDANDFPIGAYVQFGVSGKVLVKSALLLYLLPLLGVLLGAWMGQTWLGSDNAAICVAAIGFVLGGLLVKSLNTSLQNEELEPVLIDKDDSAEMSFINKGYK